MGKIIRVCILCAVSIVANRCLNHLVENILELPLFLDTLFTLAVTFAAGPLWGTLTAVLTTVMGVDYEFWGAYLYSLCSIAAVLLVWVFCRGFYPVLTEGQDGESQPASTRFVRVITILLLLSVIMCLLISIMGGIIAYIISVLLDSPLSYNPSPEFFFRLGLLQHNVPILAANILSRIPINIVDRLISVFGAYGVSLLYRKALSS